MRNQGLPWLKICYSQHFSQMEKVGANKIDLSQYFSQKSSIKKFCIQLFASKWRLLSSADNLCKQFGLRLGLQKW